MTFVIYNAQQQKEGLINLELKGKCEFSHLFGDVRICAFRCQEKRQCLHLNKSIINAVLIKGTLN